MKRVLSGRHQARGGRALRQHSLTEAFIDDYGRLRLVIAPAALVLLGVLALIDTRTIVLAVNALALSVMAIHAVWIRIRGVRTPRFALALDITVVGLGASIEATGATSAFLLAAWYVLITFTTYGRSRSVLYGYATLWYLILDARISPPQEPAITISVLFMAAAVIVILLAAHRRTLTIEMQRSQLLGSVSHELRNQLTGVIGMTDLALDQGVTTTAAEMRDLIGLARREALDAADVIEDLLTSSRMERGALEVSAEAVDLGSELARLTEHYPADGSAIDLHLPPSDLVALADPVRLRQVLRNLLSNAVRYGGKAISVTVVPVGAMVEIQVADDGQGVPPGEEETIFLPYRRAANTRRHSGSVGLGLWISRQLARAMGGDLTYRRQEGRTVFLVTLPAYSLPPARAAEVPVDEASGRG
jgi:signal transduction histidine kinase